MIHKKRTTHLSNICFQVSTKFDRGHLVSPLPPLPILNPSIQKENEKHPSLKQFHLLMAITQRRTSTKPLLDRSQSPPFHDFQTSIYCQRAKTEETTQSELQRVKKCQ